MVPDDAGQAPAMNFAAHGFVFRLGAMDDDVAQVIRGLLVEMVKRTSGPSAVDISIHRMDESSLGDTMYRVSFDGEDVYPSLNRGSLISHLLIEVNARAVQFTPDRLMLHAGTVRTGAGGILIPGASHSGKTTLAAALALHGSAFVADEVSAMHPDTLAIAPYGKPVALRPDSVKLFSDRVPRLAGPGSPFEIDERFVPPSDLGTVSTTSVEIASIVFSQFTPGAPPRITEIPPAETLHTIMSHVLGDPIDPKGTFRTLERLVRRVRGCRVEFGDADQAAELVAAFT